MALNIRGKNIEVTPALKAYVEKRVDKLTRYFDSDLTVQAVLEVKKDLRTIELTCFIDKVVLRGVETNEDMYAAIDLVVDKVIRQIHKYKTRLAKRFKKDTKLQDAIRTEMVPPVVEDEILIERTKKFNVQPMDVEEAILQMNLVEHDFFMFLNADTNVMNVVYRRKNGSYGLIEPQD